MDRRSFINLLKTASIAAPVAAVTTKFAGQQADTKKEKAERVLDTRELNCSYMVYAPFIVKDPNTGKLSGLFYDLTQKIGELAEIKMNWVAETTFVNLFEDLQDKKYDVFAGGLWPETKQAKQVNYSLPAFYSGLGVYVRADDHRFGGDANKLNDWRYRIATIDGEMSQIVQQSDFPKASVLSLPDNADISLLAASVASRKADATIIEKAVANLYMQKNPGTLRNLNSAKPIRIFENTWAFAHNEPRLKNMIDTAVKEMLSSGYVDHVLAKYEQVPNSFYRVREPTE